MIQHATDVLKSYAVSNFKTTTQQIAISKKKFHVQSRCSSKVLSHVFFSNVGVFGVSPVSIFKMCGIFAVFGLPESSSKFRNDVLRYSKLLRHRGPDWNGIACFRNCILTHERYVIFIMVLMKISVANFEFKTLIFVVFSVSPSIVGEGTVDTACSTDYLYVSMC